MTQTAADSAQMALLERLEPRLLLSGSTPLSELFGHALAAEPNPFGDIEISSQPPTPGDANLDRYVDGLDYNIWSDHYLHTGVGWDSGEFTGDDLVDGLDYNIWSQHYGTQPEPDPPPDDPVPGSDVTWYTEDLGGALGLVVLGTDGDDAITVSRSGGSTILITPAGTYTLTETFVSVELYGFGGDDLLVSISGAAETVWGGGGTDSFWADSSDTIADVEAAEAEWNVHQVTEFFQPTDDPAEYVSLELAGQDIVDPTALNPYQNFAYKPLFTDGPDYNDVIQGNVGDCYLMAGLGALAQSDPDIIEQMIAPMGDGTYAVRFYRWYHEQGVDWSEPVYLRVDADLPWYYYRLAYAGETPDGELWVALTEKAFAQFKTGENSYASLDGGWMDGVYAAVANRMSSGPLVRELTDAELVQCISDALTEGHAISAGSYGSPANPIIGSHGYVVNSVENVDGQWYVTVYNVWGTDGKTWDSNPYDGLLTISLDLFRETFFALSTCSA